MTDLTAPLHDAQVTLLRTMAHEYLLRADGSWPTWRWVVHTLDGMDLDAEQLIRSLPRIGTGGTSYGLTRGLGPHIADGEQISLTIAAAAHIDELDSVIVPKFLRVLPYLVAAQRAPMASSQQVHQPRVTSENLLRAFPEMPDFITNWLPGILEGEPATWWGNSSGRDAAQGTWYRDLSREIRHYRGVSTLAEYMTAVAGHLARHDRNITSPGAAAAAVALSYGSSPPAAGAGDTDASSPSVLPPPEEAATMLLTRLADRAGGSTTQYVPLAEFAQPDTVLHTRAVEAANLLGTREQVEILPTLGGGRGTALRITPPGLLEAERIAQARRNAGARHDHAFNELVASAYARERSELDLQEFLATTYYLGEPHAVNTVIDAARELRDHRLAQLDPPEGRPTRLTLTAQGRTCARSGTKASDYVTSQNTPGIQFNQYNYAGSTGAQGQYVTQNAGLRPEQFAEMVRQLRELAPALDVDQSEFVHEVEVLADESLELSERRRAGDRLRGWLEANQGAVGGVQTVLSVLGLFLG
ncbi:MULTISPECIES: hypothetical protein [Streptomyces]|uniref:hypothetical protein n=1 Tax=Streptomyces TaxID=1883 RepID=UPI0024A0BB69|nr:MULTISPECIES: hypothetical protein [Streptomyces]GLW02536.1 hypothetical protein Slala05_61660 [Streptomyces lavendulae subsp. lavendulae]